MALERQDARLELERQSQVPLRQPLPACGQLEPIAPSLSLLTAGRPWGLHACAVCQPVSDTALLDRMTERISQRIEERLRYATH